MPVPPEVEKALEAAAKAAWRFHEKWEANKERERSEQVATEREEQKERKGTRVARLRLRLRRGLARVRDRRWSIGLLTREVGLEVAHRAASFAGFVREVESAATLRRSRSERDQYSSGSPPRPTPAASGRCSGCPSRCSRTGRRMAGRLVSTPLVPALMLRLVFRPFGHPGQLRVDSGGEQFRLDASEKVAMNRQAAYETTASETWRRRGRSAAQRGPAAFGPRSVRRAGARPASCRCHPTA